MEKYWIVRGGADSSFENRFAYHVCELQEDTVMPTAIFLCATYADAASVVHDLRIGVDRLRIDAWDFNYDGNGCIVRTPLLQQQYDLSRRPQFVRIVHVTWSSAQSRHLETVLWQIDRPTDQQLVCFDAMYLKMLESYVGTGSLNLEHQVNGGILTRIAELPF